ncbi:MAG: DNRLRE domain-containing protein [Deltaproteobacteria bacterium]|nr:DNRLRE domain-containing protein [Deltaproteobacteria bacterium]
MRIAIGLLLLFSAVSAKAETVFVEAGRDTTLIEEPAGALANGSGPVFFVGRTNQRQNSVRRGLIYFDVAAALPERARVESARLTLHMSPSNVAPHPIELHRLLAAWGEGASSASGGSGDVSAPGDATWIHTFFSDAFWVKPGGHFVVRASSSREVSTPAFYTWESTHKMVADVRLWLAAPELNFGWILLGDETTPQNVKSFASREAPDPSLRPILELTYSLPTE